MRQDNFGQIILTEQDLVDLYMQDPERRISQALVSDQIKIDLDLELEQVPELNHYEAPTGTIEDFDTQQQSSWYMPAEYQQLDIAVWLLDQCQTDAERQRVGQELLLYAERDLLPLLQYLKYLVDTLRVNNIVWGVGRGSSVASYALYLLGVHKVNSMYYDLDITEFLK
jgi:DNA polymerase III alpha subunit